MGASGLAALCAELERAAGQPEQEGAAALLAMIVKTSAAVSHALHAAPVS